MSKITYSDKNNEFRLNSLLGFDFFASEKKLPFRLMHPMVCQFDDIILSEENVELTSVSEANSRVLIKYTLAETLQYTIEFALHDQLIVRSDRIENISAKVVDLHQAAAQFHFAIEQGEMFYQKSSWCAENEGQWYPLASLHLNSESGRTNQGAAPLAVIKNNESSSSLAFHIIPQGDWEIILQEVSSGIGEAGYYQYQLQLGMPVQNMVYQLVAGETLALPQIILQQVPQHHLGQAAPILQRYLLQRQAAQQQKVPQLVYNPWFDNYANLDNIERLKEHVEIAKEIGCEVFEIDAGWYGAGSGDWQEQCGDWRERLDGGFRGRMLEFVEYVEQSGLRFGLWMEPERVAAGVPVFEEHREYLQQGNKHYYFKLWEQPAYDYLYGEMCRLIKTYRLAWLKLDFNFELGIDKSGKHFHQYYQYLFKLLDQLRAEFPEVFIEGCEAGAQRLDISMNEHLDGHFMSDNTNPWFTLNMFSQSVIRLQPHKLIKWLVVAPGAALRTYSSSELLPSVIVPRTPGAGFDSYESIDIDFACKAAMAGFFNISGDFAGLAPEFLEVVKSNVAFYKKHREFFVDATCALHEQPKALANRSGFLTLEYRSPAQDKLLLFLFKFRDQQKQKRIILQNLQQDANYDIYYDDCHLQMSGTELMKEGVLVPIKNEDSACIVQVEKVK